MDRVCYSLQCKTCHDIKQNFTREEIWRNIVWFSSHVKENYSKFILRQYILSFIQSLCFMVGNNMTIEINSSLSVQGEEKLALNFILNFQCDRWLKLIISYFEVKFERLLAFKIDLSTEVSNWFLTCEQAVTR